MSDMAIQYEHRPISVADYHRMFEAGIISADERIELLDGELIAVAPMRSPHAGAVTAMSRVLFRRLNANTTIRVQLPLVVHRTPTAEGYGDVAILGPDDDVAPLAIPYERFRVGKFIDA